MFFNPFSFLLVIFFFGVLLFFFIFVQINMIALAFAEIGIPSQYIFSALLATLVGSFINIPIKRLPQESMGTDRIVRYFGFRYVLPDWKKPETVLAVNVGGALVPILLSVYLLLKTGLWIRAGIATLAMTLITYVMARPVKGLGIALPGFLPPILAALIALILGYRSAPVVAYVAGTAGTLIGADILHLNKISGIGASVASIGGAGTFDGIFLNGVLAVLLAALLA